MNKVVVSDADGIFTVGDYDPDVGYDHLPFYTRNGDHLDHQGFDASAWDIFLQGDDVYVAGWYRGDDGNFRACYWKNGARTDLAGGVMSEARGISLIDGNVYVVGWYRAHRAQPCDLPGTIRSFVWRFASGA